jgi:flagellin-specific chaperone FliS
MNQELITQELEIAKLQQILEELQSIIEREKKRHMMDEHLTHSMRDLLEYEIIPMLEAEVYYDPTPQY